MIYTNNLEVETKFYSCKYDACFKEVFINEKGNFLLKKLLEYLLNIKIKEIVIKNSELENDNVNVRRKLVDSLIYTDKGVYNIEVNISNENYVNQRNFSYISNAYSKYVLRGEEYDSSIMFIQINFSYNLKDNELYRIYKISDDDGNNFIDNFLIYEYNMDKYLEFWYNGDKKEIDKYKYLIMIGLEKEELKNLSNKDKVVEKFMDRLNTVNEDPRFQSYMSREEDERKIKNSLKKEYYNKGVLESAKKFIEKGYSKEEVAQILEIPESELENL